MGKNIWKFVFLSRYTIFKFKIVKKAFFNKRRPNKSVFNASINPVLKRFRVHKKIP